MISGPPHRLKIRDYVAPGQWYHVARYGERIGGVAPGHCHDFPEVFWIERGQLQHLINGQRQLLGAGDVVLIRPQDTHSLAGYGKGLSLVNLAFPLAHLESFRRRYYRPRERAWPWQGGTQPARFRVGTTALDRLAWLADELAAGPQSRLRLEAFLSGMLLSVGRPGGSGIPDGLPAWLQAALVEFAQPKHLAGGVPELARLAGRTREHINRVVRARLGQTTTDLFNGIRLEYAARQLGMSGRPILEVALDAGFDNLSYFYRSFQRRFGLTPRRYRQQRHGLLGEGG